MHAYRNITITMKSNKPFFGLNFALVLFGSYKLYKE